LNIRIEQLRKKMNKEQVDGLIIQSVANRKYMSLFTGSSAFLYISQQQQVLLTDFRYVEQANIQSPNYQVIDYGKKGLYTTLNELLKKDQVIRLGFEAEGITYAQYDQYKEKLEVKELVPICNWIESLRMIKSEDEIRCIQKAASIADQAFTHILSFIKVGVSEKDIALELEFFMKKQGAENLSFDTIVASGVRSSLPHGAPTDKKIQSGDFVTMDFGCIYQGYCSDMTRTVVVGKANEKQKKIYHIVLEAQEKALKNLKAQKTGKEIDTIARNIISEQGYGDYFGHGLGHSVGLEIHESPRLSINEETILKPNMSMTVEPGIYIPDFGGVRIEDLVIITEDGVCNLTTSSKELIEL